MLFICHIWQNASRQTFNNHIKHSAQSRLHFNVRPEYNTPILLMLIFLLFFVMFIAESYNDQSDTVIPVHKEPRFSGK